MPARPAYRRAYPPRTGFRLIERAPMIRTNTMIVPITATPMRTGSASAAGISGEAAALAASASGLGGISDGSGSIRLPILVPGGAAKP